MEQYADCYHSVRLTSSLPCCSEFYGPTHSVSPEPDLASQASCAQHPQCTCTAQVDLMRMKEPLGETLSAHQTTHARRRQTGVWVCGSREIRGRKRKYSSSKEIVHDFHHHGHSTENIFMSFCQSRRKTLRMSAVSRWSTHLRYKNFIRDV